MKKKDMLKCMIMRGNFGKEYHDEYIASKKQEKEEQE